MVHTFIGDFGHFLVITSFITAIVAALGFIFATNKQVDNALLEQSAWLKFARITFGIHVLAVLGIIISLFTIIYRHYYEYHYAWEHSSNDLPVYYMISCFWEGQEGSFLLWIFWNAVLGTIIIFTNKKWEAPVMAIFALVQAFLCSMILGVVLGESFKIGSSPFILLRDFMADAPVFKMNIDFIPKDGTGLNPLLQNYWMVIHPPTLFLGFALTLVPFSFCIAGLWIRDFKEWIRPALPWALLGAAILGVGILMGAYWAYETLNFGGYWNWDPVENAVYIPWLILVASIHTMIIFKNSETALRTSIILVISTFLLVLYSTFLTRSGILGNASVHSFTDLGLSGQLLIYLVAFVLIALFFVIKSWKYLPSDEKEASVYTREFWIFLGVTTLCLASFQVLVTTSIPVYNAILKSVGIVSKAAPPANQMKFYSDWQIWFMMLVALFSGAGQFFYWKKMDAQKAKEVLYKPVILSLVITLAVMFSLQAAGLIIFETTPSMTKTDVLITYLKYFILLVCSVFSIVANGFILANLLKSNYKLSGGAVTHMGVALMLIGVLYSSGYSKIVSLNSSGLLYSKEFTDDMNKENVLLFRHQPVKMGEFTLTYQGPRVEADGFPGYINKEEVSPTDDAFKAITNKDLKSGDKVVFKKGDTLKVSAENTYYEIKYQKGDGEAFTLYPRAQVNPQMGFIASPDIKRFLGSDLYTHVSSVPDPKQEKKWSEMQEQVVHVGDTFFVNDHVALLEGVDRVMNIEEHGIQLGPEDAAVKARVRVLEKTRDYTVMPTYIIKDKMVGRIPEVVHDLGLKIVLLEINPKDQTFTFGTQLTQKDWVILKASEKPLINLLWIGTFVVVIGFCMAIARRYSDFKAMRDKGLE